jgi:uncharacterized protein (DUF4415 family)
LEASKVFVYEYCMSIARQFRPKPPAAKAPGQPRKNKGGRPRKANAKVAVTIRLEPDVLDEWKAKGPDWRSLMEERLRG